MVAHKNKPEGMTESPYPQKLARQETASLKEKGNIGAIICEVYIIVNGAVYTPPVHFNNINGRFLHGVWASGLFDKIVNKVVLWFTTKCYRKSPQNAIVTQPRVAT
jgi:hypothetical protein